jgi:Asp/Glu/hydantoin racemase
MDEHVENTIELLAQHTDQKPSADAILLACIGSALVDAVNHVAKVLGRIDSGIDEANSLNERRLDRGQ